MKQYTSTTSFLDFLFNLLLAIIALLLIVLLLINPPEVDSDVSKNVSHIITIRWDGETTHDVDLWITDGNETVGFRNRQGTNFFLERDDLGNDSMSRVLGYRLNEESMNILDSVEGTYTVNVHLFQVKRGEIPVRVTWILQSVQPHTRRIDSGEVYLHERGDEKTLLQFSFNEDGEIHSINYDNNPFVLQNMRDRRLP